MNTIAFSICLGIDVAGNTSTVTQIHPHLNAYKLASGRTLIHTHMHEQVMNMPKQSSVTAEVNQ